LIFIIIIVLIVGVYMSVVEKRDLHGSK